VEAVDVCISLFQYLLTSQLSIGFYVIHEPPNSHKWSGTCGKYPECVTHIKVFLEVLRGRSVESDCDLEACAVFMCGEVVHNVR
jgi:hypothetical protein